jgi:hypothetical protein
VDAVYAIPGENLGISSVRERYYLGLCRSEEDYIKAIDHINQFRDEILNLVSEFEYLDEKVRTSVYSYLEEYFRISAQPEHFTYSLNLTCR